MDGCVSHNHVKAAERKKERNNLFALKHGIQGVINKDKGTSYV